MLQSRIHPHLRAGSLSSSGRSCYHSSKATFVSSVSMVRVRLKTKLVLAINGMVFLLVALFCYVYISHRLRQSTQEADDIARFIANEIVESVHEATQDLRPLDVDI